MKRLLFCMLLMLACTIVTYSQITVDNQTNCPVVVEGYCYLAGNCDYLPNQPGYTSVPPCGGCGGLAPLYSVSIPANTTPPPPFSNPPCTGFPFAMDFAYRVCMLNSNGQPCSCSGYWSTDPSCPYYPVDPMGGEIVDGASTYTMSGSSFCDCPGGIRVTFDANGNATIW